MTLAHLDQYQTAISPSVTADNQWIELMQPAAELAGQIAGTEFVPAEFRNKPAAIAACILYGAEIGIGPMMSLAKIDIVKGRPAPRAELGRALALAAGHEVWVEERTNTRVTVAGRRKGSQHVDTVTWTMDDAKKAGIASNPAYAKYPRQMLLARASAELVRSLCPEVLGGITVFAEEAADIDDADAPIVATVVTHEPNRQTRRRNPQPVNEVEPVQPPLLPDEEPDLITPDQLKKLVVTIKEVGITDRDDKLAAIGALVGHTVDSSKELTKSEASTVIDGLDLIRDGSLAFDIDNDGNWSAVLTTDAPDQPELPDEEPF
jgi:hypothetical protein